MTNEECIAALVNHNGGWWVVGTNTRSHPGDILSNTAVDGSRLVIVATATEAEAYADYYFVCTLVGKDALYPLRNCPYWYKVMCD